MRVDVVVPDGYDDPARPSGGNRYDQRLLAGLTAAGWDVRVRTAAASGDDVELHGPGGDLAAAVGAVPDDDLVLVDGLLASSAAAVIVPHARRVRLVVLLHMPLITALDREPSAADLRSERQVLEAAAGVVVPSAWTRDRVVEHYALSPDRVHVARPGTDPVDPPVGPADPADPADPAGARSGRGSVGGGSAGGHLLCVATLGRHKGQDVLIEALGTIPDLDWDATLVGPTDRDPAYTERIVRMISERGLAGRVRLTGTLAGPVLRAAYAVADLLVVASRSETYGMVVGEAIAHGLPVLATAVGGLPEALGLAGTGDDPAAGRRPGVLIAPDDPVALSSALTHWLTEPAHRVDLRSAAAGCRSLRSWAATTRDVSIALRAAAATAAVNRGRPADVEPSGRPTEGGHG